MGNGFGSDRTIRVGMIGTGTISRSHARSLEECSNVELTACCDVVEGALNRFADEFNVPGKFGKYEDLLDQVLDAVVVATPPFAHQEPVVAALRSGKHVLCEKPFAMNADEAADMAHVSAETGKALAVCSSRFRFQPRSVLAFDTISAGVLGDIYRARLVQLRRRGRPGFDILKDSAWFLDHARSGGGVIADMGQYFLDQMMWYLGWPQVLSVSANVTHNKIEPVVPKEIKNDVEEHFDADIRLEGGTTLSLEVTWLTHMEGANGIWLYGTDGGLKLGSGVTLYHDMHGRPVETEIPLPRRVDESNVTRDFIEAIREGREPVTTADQGVVISKIVDAIYKSSETRAEVRF